MRMITRAQIEDVRDELDAKVQRGTIAWKTALHVWTNLRCIFRDACLAKRRDLRVREDNPTQDVAGPDRGNVRAKQFLFPSEFLQLVSCDDVPLRWRRIFTVATYLALRAGELEALGWEDVLLDHGVVHVHRSIRRFTKEEKATKTGATRRFAIEPPLLPLLHAMRRETGDVGRVMAHLPTKHEFSKVLRHHLIVAGVEREELFANDATRKWITFHDLRATGITWMAVRGDEPL
jgi:integrase